MKKLLLLSLVLMLAATSVFAGQRPALSLPISGTFTNAAGVGNFEGTFKLTEFVVSNNQLMARGVVMGVLTDATGRVIGSAASPAELPVTSITHAAGVHRPGRLAASANATCDILNLVLGPLHLDLLGLTVDLNQVVLDIAAETGAGNLLGNLLCAVVSLLDGTGALLDIANLLNRILDILTGILG